MVNGEPTKFEGYCTDVWFDQAMAFIERSADAPFLCYVSTNAPHGPFRVADSYSRRYRGRVPDARARFYGMITNIDENLARLRAKLRDLDIERDTILIFMTDNGTAAGCGLDRDGFVRDGYNAGMRGVKGSEYDGGHRVTFFMRWPAGGLTEGRDVDTLTANIDILPTLADMCGIPGPDSSAIHGQSILALVNGDADGWPERVIVTDSQRVEMPIKWRKSATMTDRWRLVNGEELYDIRPDPEQRVDVADQHPAVVETLRGEYERWWETVSERFDDDPAIIIGSEHEPVSRITCHDWHNEDSSCAWNQGMVRQGVVCNGDWAIDVARPGVYAFELRRWPREEALGMTEGMPGEIMDWFHGGKALPLQRARVRVGDEEANGEIAPTADSATFHFALGAGATRLQTWLSTDSGEALGAYYVYACRTGD